MRKYAIFFIAIPVAALCVRLGIWQLSRLRERRARNAEIRSELGKPPLQVQGAPATLPGYQRVQASGVFDYDRQIVVTELAFDGTPSVVVVTPLKLADSGAVLVERGWVPSPDANRVVLDSVREADSASVDGVVIDPGPDIGPIAGAADSGWPKYIQRASPRLFSAVYPYRVRPYLVRRTTVPRDGRGARFRPVPLGELNDGPHLSYAIQWFSFAIIAVVGSTLIYRKEQSSSHPAS